MIKSIRCLFINNPQLVINYKKRKSLNTYDDLIDEQKEELVSFVLVKDIPDSHIIDVIQNDYLGNKGQLEYILIQNFL
ncbi:hypothetical protein BU107_10280 [Staphylococcus xylosus]|uniref:hypothetical protein n=1 Tax=Staphylococcus xylosus TaxID=1288 RepID=UPI000E694148|nr:hypothetical protein [Staphylococcus xylosus]RIM86183.1 hypothetical protein BU107_10280 [Staphylococcus xylosus]